MVEGITIFWEMLDPIKTCPVEVLAPIDHDGVIEGDAYAMLNLRFSKVQLEHLILLRPPSFDEIH